MPSEIPTHDSPQTQLARLSRLHPRLVRLAGDGTALPAASQHRQPGLLDDLARPGLLVDLLSAPGSGAGLVGLRVGMTACQGQADSQQRGELVVVDPSGEFYPPAAVAWGVDPRRLLVVSPRTEADTLAVVEQALESGVVRAVWACLDRIPQRASRRLLLAAESGQATGVLVRPDRRVQEPTCADRQVLLQPLPAGQGDDESTLLLKATETRNRHGPLCPSRLIQIDWRTGKISERATPDGAPAADPIGVAAGLADSTATDPAA